MQKQYIPAGSTRKDPSGDHANLRKKDGSVSSWNKWDLIGGCKTKDYIIALLKLSLNPNAVAMREDQNPP